MGMPAKMNTSESMLDRFWQGGAGINYFSTANNHCFDYGEEGLYTTLDLSLIHIYDSGNCLCPESFQQGEPYAGAFVLSAESVFV